MRAGIFTSKIFTDTYTVDYQCTTSYAFSIYSKNGTFFMDYSGNNTILPLPSCEDVELFNLFQQKWNYLSREMLTAEIEMQSHAIMANNTMLSTPAIVTV